VALSHRAEDGDAARITCLLVPADDPGIEILEYMWTFNIRRSPRA